MARSVPRPWREEVREISGRALLAGRAGGEVASGMGKRRRVHFATEGEQRGADSGAMVRDQRRRGEGMGAQSPVSGLGIREQGRKAYLPAAAQRR